MMRVLLVVNASYGNDSDNVTGYLYTWCEKILDYLHEKKYVKYLELNGSRAIKKELAKLIETEKPKLLIFNGHGEEDSIKGFEREILIRYDYNEDLLKGKIVHAMSCEAGRKLGPRCISIGTIAYIGYSQKFKLPCENRSNPEDQLKDPYAGFILDPAFEAVLALSQGATVQEAYERSQTKYKQMLGLLVTHTSTTLNTVVASQLYHNLKYQVCLGDPVARF